jgi:hypothetical protein
MAKQPRLKTVCISCAICLRAMLHLNLCLILYFRHITSRRLQWKAKLAVQKCIQIILIQVIQNVHQHHPKGIWKFILRFNWNMQTNLGLEFHTPKQEKMPLSTNVRKHLIFNLQLQRVHLSGLNMSCMLFNACPDTSHHRLPHSFKDGWVGADRQASKIQWRSALLLTTGAAQTRISATSLAITFLKKKKIIKNCYQWYTLSSSGNCQFVKSATLYN